MKFLVATDGSEESEQAVERAVSDAIAHGATLEIVHVVPTEPEPRSTDGDETPHDRGERLLADAHSRAVEKASDETVTITTELKTGRPANAITDHIDESEIDSLYLGHRVRPAQQEASVGSVAKHILDTTTIPVTIVR